jgi:hypothetical protein
VLSDFKSFLSNKKHTKLAFNYNYEKYRAFDAPYAGYLYTRISSSDNTWRGSIVDGDSIKIWSLRNNTKIKHR